MLIALIIAAAGLTGASVYLGLALLGVLRFLRAPATGGTRAALPPVTLLKPLHGDEPRLEQSLESFFLQDYERFEIVFGARHADDPALKVVERLRSRYPKTPVKVVLSGEPHQPNAKICTLIKMLPASEHRFLIISDSDVHVGRDYIRQVVTPLLDDKTGMVTCLYRGVPTGGLWSRLEALGMSVEMTSGVLVAEMLEGMKFALGPTMATRTDVLAKVGGFEALGEYCSDDYLLGKQISEAGYKVVLSKYVIDHIVLNQSLRQSLDHQARWMRSTRFSREWGHVGTGLTFAVPFGVLALIACWGLGRPMVGAALLGWAILNRIVQSVAAGWLVVRDRNALRYCWLYPLRDLSGFLFWMWSFLGTTIVWRGERYRLLRGGRMAKQANAISTSMEAGLPPARD